MSPRKTSVFLPGLAVFLGASLLTLEPARAVDLDSQDLLPGPVGTNILLGYFTYAQRNEFTSTNGRTYKDGTGLKSFVSIIRYARYMDLFGLTVAPQVLLPYGRLFSGSLAGTRLDSAGGSADIIFAAPVWFLNQPRTTLSLVPYLYAPTGSYVPGRTLNVGENRWKFDLQLGATQQLGHGFATQLSADVMWYGTNHDASGIGLGQLKQKNSYQFQGWLTYTPPSNRRWTFSAGYSKNWGGVQRVDGVENGQATRSDQIRDEVSGFTTPTFQVQGLLAHDIKVNGGFKQDLSATLRLLKVF